jgi:hypothetical protein
MDKQLSIGNSTITIEPDLLNRGYSCTFFISDYDIINAPVSAMALLDEAFEDFRRVLCNILDITDEKEE